MAQKVFYSQTQFIPYQEISDSTKQLFVFAPM